MDTNALAYMETFYMALADRTRLRLLNLMRDGEVCVCFFTEVLGESQPKISRHLAYLRNSELVRSRRDGKWMHYSIVEPADEGGKRVLDGVLAWLDEQTELRAERDKYKKVCCTPELLVQIARTPIDFLPASPAYDKVEWASDSSVLSSPPEPEREADHFLADTGHNEIEEFLL
ncbi:MAG: metalloregulator ArsR/SmtB family transcription factor [Chloracidobacterium sp.]|nr:metalloregulator ArsR/SmtB family transcription factor [Chloracidobacterium sp.]